MPRILHKIPGRDLERQTRPLKGCIPNCGGHLGMMPRIDAVMVEPMPEHMLFPSTWYLYVESGNPWFSTSPLHFVGSHKGYLICLKYPEVLCIAMVNIQHEVRYPAVICSLIHRDLFWKRPIAFPTVAGNKTNLVAPNAQCTRDRNWADKEIECPISSSFPPLWL